MSNRPRLILPPGVGSTPAGPKVLVRNRWGKPLPCCYGECWEDGDDRIHIDRPHPTPNYLGEMRRFIFCSERHRVFYLADLQKAAQAQAEQGSPPQ